MCFGTFDILHLGHISYFKQAREHGDHLIVVVARDKTKKKQNKTTLFNEDKRLAAVNEEKLVNEAVLGDLNNHFKVIKDKQPNIICLGYDQEIEEEFLRNKLIELNINAEVIRLNPYQENKYKSSIIKKREIHSL